MEYLEVLPRKGIGPLRLGMAECDAEERRHRIFSGMNPDSCSRVEYREGRLASVSVYQNERWAICFQGLNLSAIHAEDLIPQLARQTGYICDCVDPELANVYRFPDLGLELWRERVYHPKLLDNPEFQALIQTLPENLAYEQENGWTFQVVTVCEACLWAQCPLEQGPAPYNGGSYRPTPSYRPPTLKELEAIKKKYGLQEPR